MCGERKDGQPNHAETSLRCVWPPAVAGGAARILKYALIFPLQALSLRITVFPNWVRPKDALLHACLPLCGIQVRRRCSDRFLNAQHTWYGQEPHFMPSWC